MWLSGDLYFDKAEGGFLKELFARWEDEKCSHEVTIVFFWRIYYSKEMLGNNFVLVFVPCDRHKCSKLYYLSSSTEQLPPGSAVRQKKRGEHYEDFYKYGLIACPHITCMSHACYMHATCMSITCISATCTKHAIVGILHEHWFWWLCPSPWLQGDSAGGDSCWLVLTFGGHQETLQPPQRALDQDQGGRSVLRSGSWTLYQTR